MGQPCWSKLYHTQGLRNIHMGLLIGRTRSAHAHWLDALRCFGARETDFGEP